MQLQTLLQVKVPDPVEFFPEFTIALASEGVLIRARSPLFARFLEGKALIGKKGEGLFNSLWQGNNLRSPLPSVNFASEWSMHSMDGLFIGDREPNLIWLTHPDLGTGCKVLLKIPISVPDLEDYFTTAVVKLRNIYTSFIREVEFSAQLSETFPQETP